MSLFIHDENLTYTIKLTSYSNHRTQQNTNEEKLKLFVIHYIIFVLITKPGKHIL